MGVGTKTNRTLPNQDGEIGPNRLAGPGFSSKKRSRGGLTDLEKSEGNKGCPSARKRSWIRQVSSESLESEKREAQ